MNKKKVLSKFTILCWAMLIAILGRVRSAGLGLDTCAGYLEQAYDGILCLEGFISPLQARVLGRVPTEYSYTSAFQVHF